MSKEKTMKKSRDENKEKSTNDLAVENLSTTILMAAGFVFVFLISIVRMIMGLGSDLGMYALLCVMMAGLHIPKAIHYKNIAYIIFSIIYVLLAIAIIVLYISGMTAVA